MKKREKYRALAEQGYKVHEIAAMLKVKPETVHWNCWRYDIPINKMIDEHPLRLKWSARRKAIADYIRNNPAVTRMAVAAHFGVDTSTVARACKEAGLSTVRQYDSDGNVLTGL